MADYEREYQGHPPWEIGRPQPAVVGLIERGALKSPVLDVGCGTGEHAALMVTRGLAVTAVDIAATAIRRAEEKVRAAGGRADFHVLDALALPRLGRTFASVLDSALFHVFDDAERSHYARVLAQVLVPGGKAYVLCFSEQEPDWGGPRRVTQAELRATFGPPFVVESIVEARYVHRASPEGSARAWLTTLELCP